MSLGLSNQPSLPPPDSSNRAEKKTLIVIAVVTFAALLGVAVFKLTGWIPAAFLAKFNKPSTVPGGKPTTADPKAEAERTRRAVLSYLANGQFAGSELEKQILGDAHLDMYFVDTGNVLLSLPLGKSSPEDVRETTARLFNDPNTVKTLPEENGYFKFGRFGVRRDERSDVVLQSSGENLKLDPNKMLMFPFRDVAYTVRVSEMADFITNKSVYGGLLNADTGTTRNGEPLIFANHGVFVAKPDEPSLKRLVASLAKAIPPDAPDARERTIQALTDFVSREIAYDDAEALASVETLKRPNETLMTRRADCSNKTILLCSLLEQIGEEYLMLYSPDHITVAVKRKGFPATNGLTYTWLGQEWVICETTLPGFQIGTTVVKQAEKLKEVRFVQQPDARNVIFEAGTNAVIQFR